jgi:hypothetical protein
LEMALKGRIIIYIALCCVFIYSAQRFLGDNRNMAERFVESELSTQVKRRATLAVVVPFIEKQLDSLLMMMQQWGEDEVRACNLERSYTLIFYNDYKMEDGMKQRIQTRVNQLEWLRKCFHFIGYEAAMIPPEKSKYDPKVANYYGPNTMWKRIFRLEALKNHTHFFLMEPDISALKDDWLDRINAEVRKGL